MPTEKKNRTRPPNANNRVVTNPSSLPPGHPSNNRGEALKNLGKNPESIQAFQEALRLNPMALELYNDIADNYFQMKQPERAIAALERGLEFATAQADRAKIERFSKRINEKR